MSHPLSSLGLMFDGAAIFGTRCVGCRRRGPVLCDPCVRSELPAGELKRPVHVDRLICPRTYDRATRALILQLKLRGIEVAADPLTAAMASHVQSRGLRATTLTWVPGRRTDTRRRGFDHAEVLARLLGDRLGLPCLPLLERVGNPADQAALNARERVANLAGAFRTRSSPERVAIVDDVMTTGSTLTSCARALRAAGARSVEAVVAAAVA